MKPGITLDQARADLLRVHKAMPDTTNSKVNQFTSPVIEPLRDRYLGDIKTVTRILTRRGGAGAADRLREYRRVDAGAR
jgi:hypothetical protein